LNDLLERQGELMLGSRAIKRCLQAGRQDREVSRTGFTLVELLIVLALLGVIMGLGMPAMLNALNRAKLTSFAQQAAAAMQAARHEAIKRSTVARVEVHFSDNSIFAYVDVNGDSLYTPGTDVLIFQGSAPAGVVLQGPGTTLNSNAVYNFAPLAAGGGVALFNSDGSVVALGGFRFRDQRGNIMEAFVSPQASARIAVRKYAGDPNGKDDPTQYFESDESPGWTWN
jgi:prepilin-type N-terminal cleavage/methylation domain-containing protein